MTTQHTYNRLKGMIEPDKFDHAIQILREMESEGLVLGGKDYTREQLIPFVDNIKFPTVKQSTITDPDDYEVLFDDMIHDVLKTMCVAKGIELNTGTELFNAIRNSIIGYANNWHMDLSTPQKEYNVGDKVTIYFEGTPQQAIIVNVGYEKYALLLYAKNNVIFVSDGVDSATNYILYLQHDIGYDVE